MKWFMRSFAILAGVSLTACTDPDEGAVTPVFPDETEITLNAGETKTLTFEANTAWTLSVGTSWCFLMDGEEEGKQLTGNKAGTVTFTVKAKDAGHEFDQNATAEIKLAMKGAADPRTIYKVNRPGKVREAKVYRKEGSNYTEMENGIVMAFKDNRTEILQICITANFDWKVFSQSEEITYEGTLAGTAGQTPAEAASVYIRLATEVLPAAYTGEIVISDPAGVNKITIPVTYPGMGNEDLFFNEPHFRSGQGASVSFSNKGYVMSRGSGEGPTEDMSFSFTAYTKGMKSKGYIVALDENNVPAIAENPWLTLAEEENGSYSIAVVGSGVNLGDARTQHVFILPEALATTSPDFTQWFTDGVSKGAYTFSVSQAAAPSGAGAFLAWQGGNSPVPEDRIITWAEYLGEPGDPGMFGGPYGLTADNALVYQFYEDDIDGDLIAAITGIVATSVTATSPGTQLLGTRTSGEYQGCLSVTLSEIADWENSPTIRQTWVGFYKDGAPIFGVLLRQYRDKP